MIMPVAIAEGQAYKLYKYEGNLSDIPNVKALLCWEDVFHPNQRPFCILCTETALDVVTVLRRYLLRWNIETGHRYFKAMLGFDQYQMRSYQAIEKQPLARVLQTLQLSA